MTKKLVLTKDTLAELTTDELAHVQGAVAPWTPACPLIIDLRERLSATAC